MMPPSIITDQDYYLLFQGEEGLRGMDLFREPYLERLNMEWKVVRDLGFSNYYLVVQDFVLWAKRQGISVGPARGSGGGSLLAYAVGITEVDPIKYDLVFERFLNKGRLSLPDFDIDYCMKRREEVIQYVKNKYGDSQVANIGTKGTMKAKLAVRDTARCLGLDPETVDRYGKLIPDEARGGQGDHAVTLPKCIRPTEQFSETHREALTKFQQAYDQDRNFQDCVNRAAEIEGLPKSIGIHAAGVIIWDQPITSVVPLMRGRGGSICTQWVDKEVEQVGLVKYDFLGLRTLTVIAEAEASVLRRTGRKINWDLIPDDDSKTYSLLSSGDCLGVFQLTDRGITEFTRQFEPESIEDIAAISALYRPGPLDSGMCDEILEIRSGLKEPDYSISEIRTIMEPTSGVLTFQEQVLAIAQVMAGYSLSDADLLRRAMGKKIPKEMAEHEQRFIEGAVSLGHPETIASRMFSKIEKFADYGFNKSHAVGYSILSYRTAYLKAHYRSDFYAACMSSYDDQEKIRPYLVEAQRSGIRVTLPDINESEENFTAVNEGLIRFGLTAIRGCGTAAVTEIIRSREAGAFKSLVDFCYRVHSNVLRSNNIEALANAGAFGALEESLNRAEIASYSKSIAEALRKDQKDRRNKQTSMFENLFESIDRGIDIKKPSIPFDIKASLELEKEVLGFYISGHPLDQYQCLKQDVIFDEIASIEVPDLKATVLGIVREPSIRMTKRGSRFGLCEIEDSTGVIPVKFWSKSLERSEHLLHEGQCVILRGVTNEFRGIEISAYSLVSAELEASRLSVKYAIHHLSPLSIGFLTSLATGEVPVDLEIQNLRYRLGRFDIGQEMSLRLIELGALKETL